MTPRSYWVLAVATLMLLGLGAWFLIFKPIHVETSAELPAGFPADSFDHSSFENLLKSHVGSEGGVDYEAWHSNPKHRDQLKRYLAAVAQYSPDNAKERFSQKSDEVAYWIYAYNAMVIDSILDRWPLGSVTDVKAPLEVVKGFGFFYKLKFTAGGQALSLYEIEHDKVIAQAEDPRVHFVLNCGSGGCPVMRPKLPTGDELEPFLAKAAADFVAEERNVSIDHAKQVVRVSKIFDWYKDDFLNELRRRGKPIESGILGYLLLAAEGPRQEQLERAMSYEIVVSEYDWSVNDKDKR